MLNKNIFVQLLLHSLSRYSLSRRTTFEVSFFKYFYYIFFIIILGVVWVLIRIRNGTRVINKAKGKFVRSVWYVYYTNFLTLRCKKEPRFPNRGKSKVVR